MGVRAIRHRRLFAHGRALVSASKPNVASLDISRRFRYCCKQCRTYTPRLAGARRHSAARRGVPQSPRIESYGVGSNEPDHPCWDRSKFGIEAARDHAWGCSPVSHSQLPLGGVEISASKPKISPA
jgi:hypothetical protein